MRKVLLLLLAMLGSACAGEGGGGRGGGLTAANHSYFPLTENHAGIDCATCHTSPTTFATVSCTNGCHAQPDIEPAHTGLKGYSYSSDGKVCLTCHPNGTILSGDGHDRFFPLATHRDQACTDCHSNPKNRKQIVCSSCHVQKHPDVNQQHVEVGGFGLDDARCLACHADAQVNKVVEHKPFPIASGAKHYMKECAKCHPQMRSDKPFGIDFKVKSCIGCHDADGNHDKDKTDGQHAGVDGYSYDDAACLTCHSDGGFHVDHSYFPIDTGSKHASQACSDCHPGGDKTKAVCSSCHLGLDASLGTKHVAVGGYAAEDGKCLACHADAQVNTVATHLPFPITSGQKHYQTLCVGCHPAMRTDKPFGIDFKTQSCIGCHDASGNHDQGKTDAQHAGIPGYAYDDKDCLTCHGDGGTHFNHTYFPIDAGTKHATQVCADCHPSSTDKTVVVCSSCHLGLDAALGTKHAGVHDYATDDGKCLRCHGDAQVDPVAMHLPFAITAGKPHQQQDCLTCHPQVRADKMFAADFKVQDCIDCHDASGHHDKAPTDAAHVNVAGYTYDTPSCIKCHPDGTFDHSKLFPIGPGTNHRSVACTQCHTNPADYSQVDCFTCHLSRSPDLDAKHAEVAGYQHNSAACVRCHPNGTQNGN